MIIVDQNFNEVVVSNNLDWGGSGSFMPVSKINQLASILNKITLDGMQKVMLVVATNIDTDKINQSDVDLVIINFSDHPFNYYDPRELIKPYVILHWDFREPTYHPYHLIYSASVSEHDSVDFGSPRPFNASIVNGKPRIHRIYTMLKLYQQWYWPDLQKTWRQISEYNYIPDWDLQDIKFTDINDAQWSEFYQIQSQLPDTPVLTEELSCAAIGPGFTDSYLNLVTEASCENNGFLSEKIYKPIRAGQLFLVQGPPGAVSAIRDMGFDVFDDYFDHGSYDTIVDWQTRSDAVISELTRVYTQIPEIWYATTERRIQNAELLRSGHMMQQCLRAFEHKYIVRSD